MLPLTNVMHLLAHELARLRRWRLSLPFSPSSPFLNLSFWHSCSFHHPSSQMMCLRRSPKPFTSELSADFDTLTRRRTEFTFTNDQQTCKEIEIQRKSRLLSPPGHRTAVEIESKSSTIVVRFRSLMLPEMVEGVLPETRQGLPSLLSDVGRVVLFQRTKWCVERRDAPYGTLSATAPRWKRVQNSRFGRHNGRL
jgi:hypothetical protein